MSASQALGSTFVEATSRDHCQHDGGTVGATLAAGEGPVAPSHSDASQCALGAIVGRADPAVVEAGEVVPAPEHVVDWLQDLGGAREGFALAQQPGVHVLKKRLALFLAHDVPLVGATAVDGALDLEHRIEASDRLQRDRRDPVCPSCLPGHFFRCQPARRSLAAHGQSKTPVSSAALSRPPC